MLFQLVPLTLRSPYLLYTKVLEMGFHRPYNVGGAYGTTTRGGPLVWGVAFECGGGGRRSRRSRRSRRPGEGLSAVRI